MEVKIEDNKLICSYTLKACKSCSTLLLMRGSPWELRREVKRLRDLGAREESYYELGVCIECFDNLTFDTGCYYCGERKKLPNDFKYQIILQGYEESIYHYACKECCKNNASKVLPDLVECLDCVDLDKLPRRR